MRAYRQVSTDKQLAFERPGFMTPATGDIKRTKRSGPRTEPWGTSEHIVVFGENDESILTKGCAVSQICRSEPMR